MNTIAVVLAIWAFVVLLIGRGASDRSNARVRAILQSEAAAGDPKAAASLEHWDELSD